MVIAMRKIRKDRGFTLLELIMVVALMGIVMAYAIPGMQSLLANQRIKSAAFNLITTTMFARGEAVKRGIPIYIKAPSSNDLTGGWCVMVSSGATCSVTAPGVETMRIQQPLDGVTYTFKTTAGVISFNRSGRLSNNVSVDIVDNTQSALKRCITIDVGGTARSTVGACP